MRLAAQRRLSFEEKIANLERSFQVWELQSADGKPFRKNNRQLKAIFVVLRRMLASVEPLGSSQTLGGLRNAEKGLLAVHRIWEYFRSKLAQRLDPLLGKYLQFADELAWACYAPIQRLAFTDACDGRFKEPPLVHLNGGTSPFALARLERFSAEEVPGEPLDRSWQSVTRSLPVSVIGVPWYQAERTFDALVIAHEVGHIVERDFDLERDINALLDDVALKEPGQESRRAAWKAWRSEVFADIFGCLSLGPSFVSNLLETIAVDDDYVRTEIQVDGDWGKYPTLFIRGLLNIAALDSLGFKVEAGNLKAEWRNLYRSHEMGTFESDVDQVVQVLLDGPYELWNGSLRAAMPTIEIHQGASHDVLRLQQGASPTSDDYRKLFAAARLAYERNRAAFDPRKITPWPDGNLITWSDGSWPGLLEKRMSSLIDPSVRAGEIAITPIPWTDLDTHWKDLGDVLLKDLISG